MIVTHKFTLPEDQYDYDTYVNAKKMAIVLWDYTQVLRNKLKHTDETGSFDEAQSLLFGIMEEHNLNINEVLK